MRLAFVKYQGAGNDFIIVDAWHQPVDLTRSQILQLCDRHFGVGADGLMMIRPIHGYEFEMVYFNSDGNPGSMCGNGGRCLVDYALRAGLVNGPEVRFLASDGPHEAVVLKPGMVRLKMIDVDPIHRENDGYLLNTGSPHYVQVVDGLPGLDVVQEGRKVRYSAHFAETGVNVNFMDWSDGILHVRTYERGVEAETLSCGTGVTACALMAYHLGLNDGQTSITVQTPGGLLSVSFVPENGSFRNVWLEGPAGYVFKGEMEL